MHKGRFKICLNVTECFTVHVNIFAYCVCDRCTSTKGTGFTWRTRVNKGKSLNPGVQQGNWKLQLHLLPIISAKPHCFMNASVAL